MEISKETEINCREYIRNLFQESDTSALYYHNYKHTTEVVERISAMSDNLTETDATLLRLAGWFHDVGYLYHYHNHEDRGMLLAAEYFEKTDLKSEQIQIIVSCIEATKLSEEPRNKLEEIIKDADIGFGVTERFFETGKLLRIEWESNLNKFYSDDEWEELQYNFISGVRFYTSYANQHYLPLLKNNIKKQKEILQNKQ
jgi:HD superfamily phosphodiesterase